ncbi:tyrosine-type recombinase/integrase [bacterium]|nr:tyrosine-type recombinase/integrase [bacterium]
MAKVKGDQDGGDQPTSKGRIARKLPLGMRLRGDVYYAWFKKDGKRYQKALSSDRETAETKFHEMRVGADRRSLGMVDNNAHLKAIMAEYLADRARLKRASYVEYLRVRLNRILDYVNVRRVSELTVAMVTHYEHDRKAKGVSQRTVNMEVGALKTMLRWAVNHERIGFNPLAKHTIAKHDTPREGRAFTGDEIERLLSASPQPWRDIWYAYLVAGMRKTELASLQWRDIDTEAREIIIRKSVAKTGRERRIPIESGLWEILERRRCEPREPGKGKTAAITRMVRERFTREHVFTTSANTPLTHRSGINHAFIRCCKLAEIERQEVDADGNEVSHLDIHSFRRTFATNLITGGTDPKTVQELLGHQTLEMTMNLYAKINTGNKRQAIATLSYGKGVSSPEGVAGRVPPRKNSTGRQ